MSKEKTVVLFVRQYDDEHGESTVFTEATEVGDAHKYQTPSAFINAFSKMYREYGNAKFRIENVVIG